MTPTNADSARKRDATVAAAQLHYERALDMLLTHRGDAAAAVDRALAYDPASVAGNCLRAAIIVCRDDGAAHGKLAASIAAMAAACPDPTDPARRHAQAAQAWLVADPALALERYGAIVLDRPHDVMALAAAHALDFRLGRRPMLRHRVGQALAAWDSTMPHYASVLAMHAFGLEENGHYRQAEAAARKALAHDPRHPAAIHVLAHVLEMQGRYREGLDLLAATEPAWIEGTGFSVHLAWHRALFHLDADDAVAALAVYDARIAPAADLPALADASALLWRLMLRGVPTGERWQRLADRWETRTLASARPFYPMHALMAFAAAGRAGAAARTLAALPDTGGGSRAEPEETLARPFCGASSGSRTCGRSRIAAAAALPNATSSISPSRRRRCGLSRCGLRALVAERRAQKPASRLNRRLAQRIRTMVSVAA
jgi:hypothetical protein